MYLCLFYSVCEQRSADRATKDGMKANILNKRARKKKRRNERTGVLIHRASIA